MKKTLRHLWFATQTLIYFDLSAFFAYVFYWQYWHYRDCIAEALSSCYVVENGVHVDNLTLGGSFWLLPALVFGLLFLIGLYRWRKYLTNR